MHNFKIINIQFWVTCDAPLYEKILQPGNPENIIVFTTLLHLQSYRNSVRALQLHYTSNYVAWTAHSEVYFNHRD